MGEPDSNGWSGTLGGLSATDAHHLRFVPLLYHTLRGLSRGFLLFMRALPARLPPLFRCVLSPLDTLIVSQLGRFVKSYIFSRRYLTRTSPKENGRESPSPSQLDTIAPTFRTFFHSHLFCTLIVSHFKGFVKREIEIFSTFFALLLSVPLLLNRALHSRHSLRSLLTMIVYHRPHTKSMGNVAQIREFLD